MDHLTHNFRLFLAGLVLLTLVGLVAHRADAATLDGTFTYPAKYASGADLPLANIKHVRVEVGTCSGTAFGTLEGSQLVAPPAVVYAITVPRAFGDFCLRAQTETLLGNLSDWTSVAKKTVAEPKPNPPVFVTINATAYEVLPHPVEGTRLGRAVGTVPLGTACEDEVVVSTWRGEYHEVALDQVDLSKMPKSALVVAQCEVG